MTATKAHVIIDLSDVVKAGGVKAAIVEWSQQSDTTSSGYRQTVESRSVSVDPNGWTHGGVAAQVSMAFAGGAMHYIDASDGRLISAEPAEDGDEGAQCDIGGCWYTEGDWSDESEVRLEVPDVDDALEHPEQVAEMAQAVIDHHGPKSDRRGWAKLVRDIKAAADALDDIDADELDAE